MYITNYFKTLVLVNFLRNSISLRKSSQIQYFLRMILMNPMNFYKVPQILCGLMCVVNCPTIISWTVQWKPKYRPSPMLRKEKIHPETKTRCRRTHVRSYQLRLLVCHRLRDRCTVTRDLSLTFSLL